MDLSLHEKRLILSFLLSLNFIIIIFFLKKETKEKEKEERNMIRRGGNQYLGVSLTVANCVVNFVVRLALFVLFCPKGSSIYIYIYTDMVLVGCSPITMPDHNVSEMFVTYCYTFVFSPASRSREQKKINKRKQQQQQQQQSRQCKCYWRI